MWTDTRLRGGERRVIHRRTVERSSHSRRIFDVLQRHVWGQTRDMSRLGSSGCIVETGLDLFVQRAVDVDELACRFARPLEQAAFGAQARELQIREPRLARAEQLALAADLEILLRELEAVRRRDERPEPLLRRVGQL